MNIRYLVLLTTPAFITPAHAQLEPELDNYQISDKAVVAIAEGGSGSGIGAALPQVLLKSDISGETMKLTLGSAVDEWRGLSSLAVAVSLNAPFNKKESIGYFLTDAGLPGTASLDFELSWSILSKLAEARSEAEAAYLQEWEKIAARLENACLADPDEEKDCSAGSRILATKYATSADQAALSKIVEASNRKLEQSDYFLFKVSGSVGKDSYAWRDPMTLVESKPEKTLYSFGTTVGYIPRLDRPIGFFAGGEYKKSYKLPDKATRCSVPGNSPTVECFNAPFGPPKTQKDAVIFGAFRFNGSTYQSIPFGVELKVAYDIKDNDWGASLPVYILQNKEGGLNGGFKVSWDSEDDDVSFGVFLGTTFDFLKL